MKKWYKSSVFWVSFFSGAGSVLAAVAGVVAAPVGLACATASAVAYAVARGLKGQGLGE